MLRSVARVTPFRFGLGAVAFRSRAELRELARKLEGGGWSTLLVPDHLGSASSFAPLLIAAEATDQLRVGTLVINNDFFHPVRLAQEAATVDVLTDGRLELGVGSGWARPEYDTLGLSYDRPRDRAARLADAVRTMKRAWSGEITVPGGAEAVPAVPAPVQQPHPPLLIGGHGDAILALAAADANIVGFTGLTWTGSSLAPTGASLESLTERTDFVRAEAGSRAESLEFNVLVQAVSIGEPLEEQIEQVAADLGVTPELVRTSPLALVGSQSEIINKLKGIREQTGISYFVVFDSALDDMGPVAARLAGT
jgi:probable F420-dependent oxidoreductase